MKSDFWPPPSVPHAASSCCIRCKANSQLLQGGKQLACSKAPGTKCFLKWQTPKRPGNDGTKNRTVPEQQVKHIVWELPGGFLRHRENRCGIQAENFVPGRTKRSKAPGLSDPWIAQNDDRIVSKRVATKLWYETKARRQLKERVHQCWGVLITD